MRNALSIGFMTLLLSACAGKGESFLDHVSDAIQGERLTTAEVVSGLKEALEEGTGRGVRALGRTDGFLGDALYKIAFPAEARAMEEKLRGIGLGGLCDRAITSFNRAAEKAVPLAKPIFLGAIREMAFADAMGILRGSGDAATRYFERKTTAALVRAFRPTIDDSLRQVDATRYWGQAVAAYDKIPFVKPVATDLGAYVTGKAVHAMFAKIAEAERGIRANPAQRTTALLREVFGQNERR